LFAAGAATAHPIRSTNGRVIPGGQSWCVTACALLVGGTADWHVQESVMEFPAMKFNLLREAKRINANGHPD
jgi:hypothetical protein